MLGGHEGTSSDSNIEATKELDEPAHAGDPGGASVWFTWTAPRNGVLLIDTCDTPGLDTLLAVYTGTSLGSLSPIVSNDDACGGQSAVELHVVEDVEYRIAVDGKAGATAGFTLWWGMRPANDYFADAMQIAGMEGFASGGTYLASHEADEPFHAGEPGVGSVWFRWTPPSTGRARFDTCSPGSDTLLAVYTGSAVNGLTLVAANDDSAVCGGLGSLVEFDAFAGTTYSIAVDAFDASAAFTLRWYVGPLYPRNISPPTISGPAVENGVMTAATGAWVHANSYTYRWRHCANGPVTIASCTTITGQSSERLTVPTAALGRHIRVQVFGVNSLGGTGVYSQQSAAVGFGPPVNDAPPSIDGGVLVGEVLLATEGIWKLGTPPRTSITYLWQRCDARGELCASRKGPGGDAGLRLTAADQGKRIKVVVTVTTAGGTTSAVSHATDRILPAFRQPRLRACSVPRVVGRKVARARTILRRSRCRFQLRVARRIWSARAAGVVVSQTPKAGRRLRSGARVNVFVSKGRRR